MGINKMKRKLKILIFTLIVIIGVGVSGAYCDYFSVNAGCVPNQAPYTGFGTFGTVTNLTSAPLASGNLVQYINASGNLIVGPQANGSVAGVESLIQSFPNGVTFYAVGNDTYLNSSFTNLDGKFYHDITAQESVNYFYVRAWDGDPTLSGSHFGESQIFSAATNANTPPVPNDVALPSFQVMFPKSAPAVPTNLGVTPSFITATVNFNASFGARSYQISWGLDATASGNTATFSNSQQYPSPNSTDVIPIPINGLTDNTHYWVKVEAINSFGVSGWSTSQPFTTLQIPDIKPPQTITDLRILGSSAVGATYTVTLEWTAPPDIDNHNSNAIVSGYDIRYSSSPILATTLEGFTDWYLATSYDPTYATPTPLHWGLTQEATLTGLSAGIKSFAVKSKDTVPNWSAISNITDTQLGAPAGGYTGVSTLEQGWSIIAAGQGLPMTLGNSDLYESGAQTGDQSTADTIYQYVPNTTTYNMAYLNPSGNWIDVNTGTAATWVIEPDKGYFYNRRAASPLTWGVRPKP
jgi:hypothetical protein